MTVPAGKPYASSGAKSSEKPSGKLDAGDVVPHPLAGWLRDRVAALRAATRRRRFPGTVELVSPDAAGVDPAGQPATQPVATWRYGTEPTDHGLRVDVLTRLLTDCRCRGIGPVSLVHVRPGPHDATDLDLGWAAATAVAGAIAGVEIATVVVVSRWGWHDLRTGEQRSWVRLRAQQH